MRGAREDSEPGVLLSFDERIADVETNSMSLDFDLAALRRDNLLAADYLHIERREIQETGEYDLEGLFIRLGHAIDTVGARRVVLDSIDTLFAGIPNQAILRAELRRLFTWLKDRGISTIITAERGTSGLTRNGVEEYVSDCVILLEQRLQDELATRRLRVVKYRGSSHGTNEYPFLIEETGLSLVPVTSLGPDPCRFGRSDPDRDRQARRVAGGQGLPRKDRSILISARSGNREDEHWRALRRVGGGARRALPVLDVRGIRGATGAQHAYDRH